MLDFVGHHRKEFRFDRRFRALLGGTRRDVETQIKGGFPFLPAGCPMELDAVAAGIVLDNLKSATPSNWTAKIDELRALLRQGHDATMFAYLAETGLDLEDIYSGAKSWSELREAAFASTLASGPKETELRRACGRVVRLHAHGIDTSTALGWHGHLGNVGPLLETLSVGGGVAGPRMRRAAARALVRIVGGPVPSQEDGSRPDRYEPVTDFTDWAEWWQENAPRFEPSRRYRFGVPFAPEALFQELTSEGVPLGARRLAALELGLWSGGRRVDVRDWFARQLVHASEARHRLHEKVAVPGTFWGDNSV